MSSNKSLSYIEVNNPDFYENLHDETDSDLARLKQNVVIVKSLRITAAELEVETAALYHAQLWHDIEELKMRSMQSQDDEEKK